VGGRVDAPLTGRPWLTTTTPCQRRSGTSAPTATAKGDDPEDTSGAVTCGTCDGLRVIEGDVQDMDLAKALGWERVEP